MLLEKVIIHLSFLQSRTILMRLQLKNLLTLRMPQLMLRNLRPRRKPRRPIRRKMPRLKRRLMLRMPRLRIRLRKRATPRMKKR